MESIIERHKVHFYEHMEVELLHEYIHTGITYFINTLLNSSPSLISLRYYSEEIATFIDLAKDVYFLATKNALYAEHFYQLERIQKLNKSSIVKHIVVWFIIPYLLRKVQAFFISIRNDQENGIRISGIKKIILKLFPILYAILGSFQTLLKFKYLIVKKSQYYNLQYLATKVQTKYIQDAPQKSKYPLFELIKSPGLFFLLISHKVLASYYAQKKTQASKGLKKVEVKAPLREERQKKCPICGKKAENPAFLKVSGYVFCYKCITEYVESEKMCPITKIPIDDENIQLIYG